MLLYKTLLSIGSFIILFFLLATYFISLKKVTNRTLRQKMYMMLSLFGFFSVFMDLMEVIFFALEIKILFYICWS